MARAVRFDEYGDVDVLQVREVEVPRPGPGEVRIRVRAAGINPGEATIRRGAFHDVFPADFPSGEGTDFAGVVERVGPGVDAFSAGDDVIGFTDGRSSHAEEVTVPAVNLVPKPDAVPFEVAGALFVAGAAALASVRSVNPKDGETVLVSGAAGGVGVIAAQLAVLRGARVVGIASGRNHVFLESLGVVPVAYGDGLRAAIAAVAPDGVDAVIDTYGGGYVALGRELGVPAERINTVIDWAAAQEHGARTDGTGTAAEAATLTELADLVAAGRLTVPIAAEYSLEHVREAYTELERRHTRGKIVLVP